MLKVNLDTIKRQTPRGIFREIERALALKMPSILWCFISERPYHVRSFTLLYGILYGIRGQNL